MLPRLPRLTPPPRALSRDLLAQVFLRGLRIQLGCALLGVGLAIFLTVAPRTDVASAWWFRGDPATTGGTVTATSRVPELEPGDRWPRALSLQAVRFAFRPAAPGPEAVALVEGTSWRIGGFRDPGDAVVVEYLPDRPEVARVEGTWRRPFPPWTLLFLLLPALGARILVPAVRDRRLAVHLMRHGAVTPGEFWARDDVTSAFGLPPVHRLEYRYVPEGAPEPLVLEWATRNPLVLSDGPETPVLFDPAAPASARLLVTLPGPIRLDEAGDFLPMQPGAAPRALMVPLLSALLVLVAGVAVFL